MELKQTVTPAVGEVVKYKGTANIDVLATKKLKIETTPDKCPAGRKWEVRIEVYIVETDA